MINAPTPGAWLRARREALALTRPALAARSHCTADTIKKIEEGQRSPSEDLAALLVQALAIPPADREAAVRLLRSERVPPLGSALRPLAVDPASTAAPAAPEADPASRVTPRALPRPLTPLLGRDREQATLVDRLCAPAVRLLTLTGEGGIGKTRLALALAATSGAAFADGVAYVDLAPVSDPALVPAVIAAALGVTETADLPILPRLGTVLGPQQLLLLLDNFESVLPAAPVLAELLSAAPLLTVLVTSRVLLEVEGEHVYRVPPLSAPAAQALFVARAQAIQPDLLPSGEHAAAIAAICARLDGLPLALELAAAHSRVLSPPALLAQLEPSLPLLAGARRDRPSRQQTLRATLDWSYARLPPAAQQLFRRLAVFAGGGTLAATAALSGQPPPLTLLEVETLLNHSLVRVEPGAEEPRVLLLAPVREYAAELLAASGEAAAMQAAHAQYYVALAEDTVPQLRGRQHLSALARLAAEQANLRAALGWAQVQDRALAARLAGALWPWWAARGDWREGRGWLEPLLRQADQPPGTRARLLLGEGTLARLQGDRAAATDGLEAALARYRDLGAPAGAAACLHGLADLARAGGDRARSAVLGAESLALYRDADDPAGIVDALLFCAEDGEDDTVSAARYQEALARAQAAADLPGIALATYRLAWVAEGQDDLAQAVPLYEASLVRFRELGDKRRIATVVEVLGEIAAGQGDRARALACFAESQALYEQLGARDGLLSVAYNQARLAEAAAEWAAMATAATAGLAEARAAGHAPGIRDGLLLLGHAQLHLGLVAAAWAAYGEALTYVTARTAARVRAALLLGLAQLAQAEGRLADAAACLTAAEAQGPLNDHEQADSAPVGAAVTAGLDPGTLAAARARGAAWAHADLAAVPWAAWAPSTSVTEVDGSPT